MKRIRFCDRNAKTHFCDTIFSYYVGEWVGGWRDSNLWFLKSPRSSSLGLQPLDLGMVLVTLRVVISPLGVDIWPGRVNFRPLRVDF